MTTQTLRRQVDRLKAELDALKPPPIKPFVHHKLMAAPRDGACAAEKAAHQAELEAAQAAGIKVILLIGIKPETQSHDNPNPQTPD